MEDLAAELRADCVCWTAFIVVDIENGLDGVLTVEVLFLVLYFFKFVSVR